MHYYCALVSGEEVVTAVVNSSARFSCALPSDFDGVRWTHYWHALLDASVIYSGHRLTANYRRAGRHHVTCDVTDDECLLVVETVRTRDQGRYSCLFTPSGHRQSFWLYVVGRPT